MSTLIAASLPISGCARGYTAPNPPSPSLPSTTYSPTFWPSARSCSARAVAPVITAYCARGPQRASTRRAERPSHGPIATEMPWVAMPPRLSRSTNHSHTGPGVAGRVPRRRGGRRRIVLADRGRVDGERAGGREPRHAHRLAPRDERLRERVVVEVALDGVGGPARGERHVAVRRRTCGSAIGSSVGIRVRDVVHVGSRARRRRARSASLHVMREKPNARSASSRRARTGW